MSQQPTRHLHSNCRYCGQAISIHQTYLPGHCGSRACTSKHAVQGFETRREARLETFLKQFDSAKLAARDAIATLAKENGVSRDRVHVSGVPYHPASLVPLPLNRRQGYLAHLEAITKASFNAPSKEVVPTPSTPATEPTDALPWSAKACGTCRGSCCRNGGGTSFAFQSADTIRQVRRAHPAMNREDIIAHYTEALPDVSVEDSCVFHGQQGCVLDRVDRADICNTFRCDALVRLAEGFDPASWDALVLLGLEEATPKRIELHLTKSAKDEG